MDRTKVALIVALAMTMALLPSAAGADRSVTIGEVEFQLDPSSLTATAGEVVHFTVKNNGTIQHNLEVEFSSPKIEKKLFDTNLQPGETRTADFTFTQTGRWDMYCPVGNHKSRGMAGQITVAAASAAAATPTSAAATATSPPAATPTAAPTAPAARAPTPAPPVAAPAPPVAQPAPPTATPPRVQPPAQLPRTGSWPPLPAATGVVALMLLAGGLVLRRRR